MFVLIIKVNRNNREERESKEETDREWLAVEEVFWRFLVLTEWARTCSPPQSEEVRLFIHLGTIIVI